MGTRNLVMVKMNKEIKVAQYGQWDGNPMGQGATIAKFIQNNLLTLEGLKAFRSQVYGLKWLTDTDMEIDIKQYPYLSRDTGAEILDFINSGKVTTGLENSQEFLNDTLSCEFAYMLDLDKQLVYVYVRNTKPFTRIAFKNFTVQRMEKLENKLSEI